MNISSLPGTMPRSISLSLFVADIDFSHQPNIYSYTMNILFLIKTQLSNKGFGFLKERVFMLVPIAAGLCVLTIVLIGFLLLQLDQSQAVRQNQRQSEQIGAILLGQIALFIQDQVSLLEAVAKDSTLVQLFTKLDDNQTLTTRESELIRLFPGALRVRLLSAGAHKTEEEIYPILGYAALSMLQGVELGQTPPAEVHLSPGGKRNLAITRPVRDTSQHILGHILVQSTLDPLVHLLDSMARDGNTVILTQEGKLKLYQKGNHPETAVVTEMIPGTRWRLSFGVALQDSDQTLQMGLLGVIAVVIILAFLWIQHAFTKALNDDLVTIVNLIKDLRIGRNARYSVRFATVNSTLDIIKRIFQTPVAAPRVGIAAMMTRDMDSKPTPEPSFQNSNDTESVMSSPPAPDLPLISTPLATALTPTPTLEADLSQTTDTSKRSDPTDTVDTTSSHVLDVSADTEETLEEGATPIPVPLAVPPPPQPPKPPVVELMDLSILEGNSGLDNSTDTPNLSPKVEQPTAPLSSSSDFSLPDLSFTDTDLSDLKPTNKSTITLPSPSMPSSQPLELTFVDTPSPTPPKPSPTKTMLSPAVAPSPTLPPPPEIFRAYDIRGIVGDDLNDGNVHEIGRAIGSEALDRNQKSVVVARDGRISSPRFSEALIRGMLATGCNVIDIGQVPTPLLYYATHFLETHAGVMVTASHNPPQWNGMKVILGGETLFGEAIQKLYQRIKTRKFTTGEGNLQTMDLLPEYLKLISDIQLSRPLRLVLDCGNGVAGALAPRIYRSLGCKVEELFCQVDGNFPNHPPDPSQPQNLRDLINAVKAQQADLGIAIDGDGDRLVVVDGNGKIIWPDRLMLLFSADLLSRNPGATIIFDVKCTAHLPRVIKKHGGQPLMWKTGHSLIKAKMKEVGSLLAGEMSGHIFFKERWFGFDDGIYAGARLLELLSHDLRTPSNVFADLPDAVSTAELRVDLPEGENNRLMKSLALARTRITGCEITYIDGLRADFEKGWGLVRASNTTPSLVFRFEATTQKDLRNIQDEFRRMLLEVGPGLKLPF